MRVRRWGRSRLCWRGCPPCGRGSSSTATSRSSRSTATFPGGSSTTGRLSTVRTGRRGSSTSLVALADRAQGLLATVGRTSLVHSDLNPKNLLFDPDTLAVTGVLDWEFAHSGHPFTDLGNVLRFDRQPAYQSGALAGWVALRGTPAREALHLAHAADLFALIDLAVAQWRQPDSDPGARHCSAPSSTPTTGTRPTPEVDPRSCPERRSATRSRRLSRKTRATERRKRGTSDRSDECSRFPCAAGETPGSRNSSQPRPRVRQRGGAKRRHARTNPTQAIPPERPPDRLGRDGGLSPLPPDRATPQARSIGRFPRSLCVGSWSDRREV